MAISNIVRSLVFLSLGLGIATVFSVYVMSRGIDQERAHAQRQYEFLKIGHSLERASDFLTREARRYAVSGDEIHFVAYWKEVNEIKTRDKAIERLSELDAAPEELALLELAKSNSDKLVLTEERAMAAVKSGDVEAAQKYMFDADYDKNKKLIMDPIAQFRQEINERASRELRLTARQSNILVWLVTAAVLAYAMLVLYVLLFIIRKKISQPLAGITRSIAAIAAGDVKTDVPFVDERNEIGGLARAAETFKESLLLNRTLNDDLESYKNNLEITVEERTKDLSAANDELEEFAYRTSHDLRSPIVSSSRLLEMVEKALGDGHNDQALVGLNHAQSSLKKLEALIGDMLVLAEAKGKGEESECVDFGELTQSALEKMMHMENYERLEVVTDFTFCGDAFTKRSRVNMVLENLLSNAIKYQDIKKEKSYIKISTREVDGWIYMEVEDNGLGVPKDQQGKLFNMFQRFHPKVSFGSGLGLYLLKKCADVIKGEILYLENPAEGGGSIFRLTIPVNLAEAA